MRTTAIVCFGIAALTAVVAVQNVVGGANRPEEMENLVGYAVGSFLVPVVLLIVGLILLGKSTQKNERDS